MIAAERTGAGTIPTDPSEYAYIETAIGGPNRRGHVERIENFTPSRHATDAYRSWLVFTRDLLAYSTDERRNRRYAETGKPSVAGYRGPARADFLPFDFDAEGDIPKARRDLRLFMGALCEWDIPPEAPRLYFSGAKGFHVEIPASLFGGFELMPCADLATRLGRLAELLIEGVSLPTADFSIYDPLRLWRVPNTRHSKTGLYKIPLTVSEAIGGAL